MYPKEPALKIEHFYNDEDIELRIGSKTEMQPILQAIADQGMHVALYYNGGKNFILTILLGVNEQGMWLDPGPSPLENKHLLLSDKIVFVSVNKNVKIQFVADDIKESLFENNKALYMELPEYLLRIQRREYYRAAIPAVTPVKCTIPIPPKNPGDPVTMREVPLIDISGGGVGLLCSENETELLPENVFQDCEIIIPDAGILLVALEVRNNIEFTTQNGVVHKHVGCRFIHLDNPMSTMLQGYITRLQRERLVLAASLDK